MKYVFAGIAATIALILASIAFERAWYVNTFLPRVADAIRLPGTFWFVVCIVTALFLFVLLMACAIMIALNYDAMYAEDNTITEQLKRLK